jgi:hypothetical protein
MRGQPTRQTVTDDAAEHMSRLLPPYGRWPPRLCPLQPVWRGAVPARYCHVQARNEDARAEVGLLTRLGLVGAGNRVRDGEWWLGGKMASDQLDLSRQHVQG